MQFSSPLTAQIGFDWQELYVPLQTSYTAKSHAESMTTALLFVSCYIPLQEAEPRTRLDFFFCNTKYFTFITLNNITLYHPLHTIISPHYA